MSIAAAVTVLSAGLHQPLILLAAFGCLFVALLQNERSRTGRTAFEEEVRRLRDRFEKAFDEAPAGMAVIGVDPGSGGRFVKVNRALCGLLGYRERDLTSRSIAAVVHPDDSDHALSVADQLLSGIVDRAQTELRLRHADGSVVWAQVNGARLEEPAPPALYCIAHVHDLSDRRAVLSLRGQVSQSGSILESAHQAFVAMDSSGRITDWNHQAEATFGWEASEVVGRPLAEIIIPCRYQRTHGEGLNRFLTTEEAVLPNQRVEVTAIHRDGHQLSVEITVSPNQTGIGHAFHVFMHDVSERKEIERELRQRARQQATVADLGRRALSGVDLAALMHAAVVRAAETLDLEYAEILELRPSAHDMVLRAAVGVDQSLVGTATVLMETPSLAGYALRTQHLVVADDIETDARFEVPTLLADRGVVAGMAVPIQGEQSPFGVLCVHTSRERQFRGDEAQFLQAVANLLGAAIARERGERLDLELTQAQHLESVGQIAGGLAHDFNNLVSVMLNQARFAIDALPEGDPVRADVEEIEKAARRAAELTHQLLTVSRSGAAESDSSQINEVVAGMEKLLRSTLGEQIDLRMSLAPALCPVTMGQSQLEQILVNLAVNSRDAMPDGGLLRIGTDEAAVGVSHPGGPLHGAARRYVRLVVSDSGAGMSEEVVARVFEPFFTTKPKGEGTGLGLATVHAAVERVGGWVDIRSQLGRGTTVEVHLPISEARSPVSHEPAAGLSLDSHGETILLVEDDEMVRSLTRRILAGQGYEVMATGAADEALRVCDDTRRQVDLLLTDVVMPRASGGELAAILKERQPDLRVLYMSGYGGDVMARHGIFEDREPLLEKPFTTRSLLETVRGTLDSLGPPGEADNDRPRGAALPGRGL